MYEIVNKANLVVRDSDKATMYEVQTIKAVLLNLEDQRLRFFELIAHMNGLHTPQTVSEFETHFSKVLKRESKTTQPAQEQDTFSGLQCQLKSRV